VVRSHHERWDGTGYPDGLRGEEIPRTARILAIADVYDALTSTRSYRRALTRDEALEVMRADAGKAFDPELLPVFEEIVSRLPCGTADEPS
jgi:HD-GYP domain-containing protein (c-di-GMP phosphodiesterase class II)